MRYTLSRHAREEMLRRGISENLVDGVLQNPEQIVQERDDRSVYQSQVRFGRKLFLLRVVVADTEDPAVVITVYRTSRISSYWRSP